jgi:hypothetical protein
MWSRPLLAALAAPADPADDPSGESPALLEEALEHLAVYTKDPRQGASETGFGSDRVLWETKVGGGRTLSPRMAPTERTATAAKVSRYRIAIRVGGTDTFCGPLSPSTYPDALHLAAARRNVAPPTAVSSTAYHCRVPSQTVGVR